MYNRLQELLSPTLESLWAKATISSMQEAITIASLLVKMAIFYARAADHIPTPSPYSKDRKAEEEVSEVHMFTFHKEVMNEAFCKRHPKNYKTYNRGEEVLFYTSI